MLKRNNLYFILDKNNEPLPVTDLHIWERWNSLADRTVKRTVVTEGVEVSTVFLGLNHRFGEGPPLLYETMVFGGPLDQEMDRYTSREQALVGHQAMVKRVRRASSAASGRAG